MLDLQEDATDAVRLGCSVLGAVLLPLWMVLAASALYLVPGLGGDWMLDPATGDVSFVYVPLVPMIVRGGVVGGMVLAMGTPLFGFGFITATGFSVLGRRRNRAQTSAFNTQVGVVELDVPIIIRKRGKSGRTAHALSISLADASPLRRLLARGFDLFLLTSTVLGASMFGVLLDTAEMGWAGLTLQTPLAFAFVSGLALFIVQWMAVYDRGQTFGKILFDVRLTERGSQSRPGFARGVLVRHVLFESIDAFLAVGMAIVATAVLTNLVAESSLGALFLLVVLQKVMYFLLWPLMIGVLQAMRSVPLLFGASTTLHDLAAGTRVVRTSIGQRASGDVPLGFRGIARLIDGGLIVAAAALPISIEVARQALSHGGSDLLTIGLEGAAILLGLAVASALWAQLVFTGRTVGKQIVGIRVQALEGELSFVNVIVIREWLALLGLAVALPIVGPLLDGAMALADDRRAIHDHLAGTRVVWVR